MSKLKKLPDNCTFPQLAEVIDEARFHVYLQAHLFDAFAADTVTVRRVKVKKVYYKPGRSCRVLFETELSGRDGERLQQNYYAKMLPEDKADKIFARALKAERTEPTLGPSVALLRDLSMVVWAYPNDPNLPGLAFLANHDAVLRLLREDPQRFGLPADAETLELRLAVAKYVPGQRCGYRYRARWRDKQGREAEHRFFGKAYQKDISGPAFAIVQQIEASAAFQGGELCIPRSWSHDAAREVIWQEMMPGNSFAKDMTAVDMQRWAAPIGKSLGSFHASELQLGPGLGLSQELHELNASSRKICAAYPEHAGRCRALQARLVAAAAILPDVRVAPVDRKSVV